MRVLSFAAGRQWLKHFFAFSCDHGYTWRHRGRQSQRYFEWRFDFGFLLFQLIGHLVLGLASGLEAFSREPPWDSVGALAVRQTPETRATAWEASQNRQAIFIPTGFAPDSIEHLDLNGG
jgi:hypothetical protein